MSHSLDVFEVRPAGNMWLDSAKTLMEAVTIVGNKGPGNYMVFSQDGQEMKYYSVDLEGKVSAIDNLGAA